MRFLGYLLLIIAIAGQSQTPAHDRDISAQTVEEIKHLEADRSRAQVQGDTKRLNELLAPEFIEMSAVGTLRTKAQNLEGHEKGDAHWEKFDLVDLEVTAQQQTAVVKGRLIRKGTYAGRDMTGETQYTRYFVKRDGRWLAIFQYGVPIHGLAVK